MIRSLSQARNIQEALDLLQNKINQATLFKIRFKNKEPRATDEELKELNAQARRIKSELDELIQHTEKLVEKYGQDSEIDIVLDHISQLVNLSQDLSSFAQEGFSTASRYEVATKTVGEMESIEEEAEGVEQRADDYPQWLRDTIAATWNDLKKLGPDGATVEDLEYLRRIIREITQEQYRAKKENLQEEYQELMRLKNQVDEQLQRVQNALRKKVSPRAVQRFRKFAIQKSSEKEKAVQPFAIKKKGFLENLKEYFVSNKDTELPKSTTSSEILNLMKHGKTPGNQLKLFANLLASTTSKRTAYDRNLFGDSTVYREKKVGNEDTKEADEKR